MSFGKLYGFKDNVRSAGILAVAHENNLKLDLVETKPGSNISADYLKINKLGRVPSFVGADGFVLTECTAIAVYLASQNEKTSLLGKTKEDYASILQWISFGNTQLLSAFGDWVMPLVGRAPYNKKNVDTAIELAKKAFKVLDDHFLINTYLVGERVTLADLMVTGFLTRAFEYVFDPTLRKEFANLNRWYTTIVNQPTWKASFGDVIFAEKALENKAPAAAQQPKKEKPAAAPKAAAKAAAAEEEDEPKPEPKPKHPLEALGRSNFPIDDWKRKYKNTDNTRGDAMPWFWENVDFNEYSIWQFDFKYNDELSMVFMSANQVGGFFNRLEASRKYLMGCGSVYGEQNNSVIRGAFLVRGQEALPAFDVAPDYESYEFTKLDPKNEADRATLTDLWSWDRPVTVNGKVYEYADGKIFV